MGTGALPCQTERIVRSRHFEHSVGSAVIAVAGYEMPAFLGPADQHFGIMLLHETDSFGRLFADDDAFRMPEHDAEQGTDARRPGADNKHRVLFGDFRDPGGPETRGQNVAYEKRLFVADRVGNTVQSLIGMGHAHVLGLAAVDTAA